MANMYTVSCVKCGRKQQMTASVLAQRRKCTYCGGDLSIPPEAEAEAGAAPTAVPAPAGKPMTVNCPICAHPARYPSVNPGQRGQCQYCGAPFLFPERDGTAREVEGTFGAPLDPVQILCPLCQELIPLAGNAVAKVAPCPRCRQPMELPQAAIENVVGVALSPATSPLDALTRASLTRRWAAQQLSAAELIESGFALALIEGWTPTAGAGDPVSPFSPPLTAELVKFLVFRSPDGHVGRPSAAETRLEVPLKGEGGFPWDRMLRGEALEMARRSVTPMGNLSLKSKDRPESIRPILFLGFKETPKGSVLSAKVQHPEGDFIDLEDHEFEPLRARIRETIADAARAYFAFRSLFGMWATLPIMQGVSRPAVAAKIAAFPEFEPSRGAIAQAILRE